MRCKPFTYGLERINTGQAVLVKRAEEEIQEFERASPRTAILVRVSGVQYVGEYVDEAAAGYTPGEFEPGAPVPARLDGDRMFVKRPNGKVLETGAVQQLSAVSWGGRGIRRAAVLVYCRDVRPARPETEA